MTTPAPPRPPSRRRKRWVRAAVALVLLLAAGFGLLNWAAYRHAYAFTHYAPADAPAAPKPEEMAAADRLAAAVGGVPVPRPVNRATPASVGLAFTAHTFDMGAGLKLSVWRVDRPDPRGAVVLAPGYSAAKDSMLPEAAVFHRLGWAVYLVDYLGAGDSTGNTTTLGVREGGDVAVAVWAAMRAYPNRPVVGYGFSMGAAAVLRAAAKHLVTPFAGVALEAPFDDLAEAVRGRVRAAGLPAWPVADLVLFWGGRQSTSDAGYRPADDAAFVNSPGLVLHGTADPRATPATAHHVYDQLYGPKRLVAFDGAGHEPLVRYDPAKWEAELVAFLADVERAYVKPLKSPQFGPNGEPPDSLEIMLWMRSGKK